MITKIHFTKEVIGDKPSRAIICIHGWQGNNESLQTLVKILNLDNVCWYFPEGPYTVNGDKYARSWSYESEPGIWEINEPKKLIRKFLSTEIFPNYESENVFIIGFSQGAIICYEIALHIDTPLGGIFPIAGFFRDSKLEKNRFHKSQDSTPIIIGHGIKDEVVSIDFSRNIYKILKDQGANVELFEYNGGHKISTKYLKRIKNIINETK